MLTTDATICRAAFDLVMVIGPAPTYVKKTLKKKGSGEEVGMAFVRIEEAKFGLEDLVWAEDDEYAQQEGVFGMKPTSLNARSSSSVVGKGLVLREAEVTGRSKVPGKCCVKRPRNILRDDIQGIPKLTMKRLARKGGVVRIKGLIYEEKVADEPYLQRDDEMGSGSGSLLTRGERFSSIDEFLSFMNENKTSHHASEEKDNGDGKLLMHPVVKLAKFSPKFSAKEVQFVVGKGVISRGGNDKKAVERARNHKKKSLKSKSEDLVDKYSTYKSHGKYQCGLCEALFGSTSKMRRHLEGPHGFGEGWDCSKCGKHFKNKDAKYKHVKQICVK